MVRRVSDEDFSHLPTGYLSASAVSLYLMCPQAWKLKYVDRVSDTAVPVSIIEGKSMHRSMEENNLFKVKQGEDLAEGALLEVWGDTWADMSRTVTDWDVDNPDKVFARGKHQLKTYLKRHAKKFTPASSSSIEMKVTGKVGGVPTLGYIDLISEPTEGEPMNRIVDYKCVKRAKSKSDLEGDIQMGVYASLTDLRPGEYLCFVKTKDPKIVRTKGERTEASINRVANVFRGVSEAIKKGSFPYCDPASWKCCSKYCGVWHACKQGGKK